jgi:hypothetical protein
MGQGVAVGAEPAADCFGRLFLLVGSVYRTEIGPSETRVGHDSSSMTGWEEFGRLHPARTALNLSQPS